MAANNRSDDSVNRQPIQPVALFVQDGDNFVPWDGASTLPTGAATAANQTSQNTKLDQLHTDLTGTLNVSAQATENHIGEVGGKLKGAAATFTRPADTTAYAAKDAVSNSTTSTTIMEFDLARVTGGTGYIIKARLHTSQSTCTSRFRLWLFNVNNPTLAVDNAAYALKDADKTKSIGYIDFGACSTEGTGSDTALALATSSTGTTMPLSFECATGDTKLYGLLETLDAFTPASAQTFWIRLTADCN